MLSRYQLPVLLLLATVHAQNCTWIDGTPAIGYKPCNPIAEASSCCLEGEACLTSGLCYGSLGLVYRGACLGGWHVGECPDFCVDSKTL